MNSKQIIHRHLDQAVRQLQQAIVKMEANMPLLEVLSLTAEVRSHLRCVSELLIRNHIHHCIPDRKDVKNVETTIQDLILAVRTASKYNIHVLS